METLRNQTLDQDLVVGVFYSRENLHTAVTDLHSAGFANSEIGVIARKEDAEWQSPTDDVDTGAGNAAAGAATGAVAGAGLGGLWALGIAAGMLPAIGPIVAGGILGSVLASAAAGATAGGLTGALIGYGLSDEEAQFYESELEAGRMVLTVRAGDRQALAESILRMHGASDIRSDRTKAQSEVIGR
jgi:hypothetical protein